MAFLDKKNRHLELPLFPGSIYFEEFTVFSLTKEQVWGWVLESDNIVELANRMKDHVLALGGKEDLG